MATNAHTCDHCGAPLGGLTGPTCFVCELASWIDPDGVTLLERVLAGADEERSAN